jgi:hypothetical protein
VYDNKGDIKSVGSPPEELEEDVFLDAPEDYKVLELKSQDITHLIPVAKGDKTYESTEQELQHMMAHILKSYRVDIKRMAIVRK